MMDMQVINVDAADLPKGPHRLAENIMWKISLESKERGNKAFRENDLEAAVSRYSELIMQCRQVAEDKDVEWTDEDRKEHRTLIATAYLNLSQVFLKLEQFTHAINTATRALQGDEQPPNPKHDVLPAVSKTKAYFRRAMAYAETKSFDAAVADLKAAQTYSPDDRNVAAELRRIEGVIRKADKEARKKMGGFLKSADLGFSENRTNPVSGLKEPMKVTEGLYIQPKAPEQEGQEELTIGDIQDIEEELQEKMHNLAARDPEARERLIGMGLLPKDYVPAAVAEPVEAADVTPAPEDEPPQPEKEAAEIES